MTRTESSAKPYSPDSLGYSLPRVLRLTRAHRHELGPTDGERGDTEHAPEAEEAAEGAADEADGSGQYYPPRLGYIRRTIPPSGRARGVEVSISVCEI